MKRHHTPTIYTMLYYVNQPGFLEILEIGYKFGTNNDCVLQVDGISDSDLIAGNFAKHFQRVCSPLSVKPRSDRARRRASTRSHLAYLQVIYAYSSSCQLRHS